MGFLAAEKIVENALRLITVLDAREQPDDVQLTQGAETLNELIQHEYGDVMSSFQTERADYSTKNHQSSITIGPGKDINVDARKVHNVYFGHQGKTRYELKEKTETKIFAVGVNGPQPTQFMSEMEVDGTLRVTLWPTPVRGVPLMFSLGKRVQAIKNPSDLVMVPPDAAYSLGYLLAARLRANYGVPFSDVQDVMSLASQKNAEWKAFSVKNSAVRLRRHR